MLRVTTLVLGPSSFDRRSAGKSFLFSFSLSFHFPFLFYELFFPRTISFCFFFFFAFLSFPSLISFSHHFFFFSPFFLLIFSFSPHFLITMEHSVKGGSFLPLSSCNLCSPLFFSYFLISFYEIIPYMA